MKKLLLRSLAVVAVGLIFATAFVAASLTGRGTRDAIGTQARARSGDLSIVYYEQPGDEVVVLLASYARPASDFNELARSLAAEGYRTLAIESRGIGGSEGGGPQGKPSLGALASDVEAVLSASGVRDAEAVHVVGHAFGNRVARTFASEHPERTRSVTLIAAGGRVPLSERTAQAVFVSTLSFLPWPMREPELRFAFFAKGSEIPPYWKTGWSFWGGMAQSHAAATGRHEEFWAAGRARMLVFQADEDELAKPEDAGLPLAAEFPNRVRLVRVPGAGHALLPEQPELIERELLSFLSEHPR